MRPGVRVGWATDWNFYEGTIFFQISDGHLLLLHYVCWMKPKKLPDEQMSLVHVHVRQCPAMVCGNESIYVIYLGIYTALLHI